MVYAESSTREKVLKVGGLIIIGLAISLVCYAAFEALVFAVGTK